MEKKVLAALVKSREAFDRIIGHISEKDFTEQGAMIVREIEDYYSNDTSALSVDRDILLARIERRLNNPKHSDLFSRIIKGLPNDASAENIAQEFIEMKLDKAGERLGTALINKLDKDQIGPLIDDYTELMSGSLMEEDADEFYNKSIEEVVNIHFTDENLIPVFPRALNDRIDGGLTKGSHVLVYGRPNMGKSLFAINAAACYLRRGYKVLYILNEDPGPNILLRIVSNLVGMSRAEIVAAPHKAQELAEQVGYSNFILKSMAPGTFREIAASIEKHEPDIVVIDQLRNIYTSAENRTNQLEKAATGARNLCKKYGVVVYSVTQAGESAEGHAVVGMNDVDGSKTGMQGQVDLMIGVGATEDMQNVGQRMINIAKNKITDVHEHFPVEYNTMYSKVRSM